MRNLKKFLALVLAMMMAFSLMTVANAKNVAKDYPDAGQVTAEFQEAVDVLTGMKVYKGKDTGNFDPTGKITRAEVAAIIYRLVTGDVTDSKDELYVGSHHFSDVPSGAWYEGYVSYCAAQGIIKGSGGKFMPYREVTGYEVLAMVLRAMGYDQNGEFTGPNWRVGVSTTAQQRGLLVDVNKTHYANTLLQASAREVVASIVFQAAQKTRVKYTPAFGYQSGDYNTVEEIPGRYNDYTPLGKLNFGLTRNVGIVVGNQATGEDNTKVGLSVKAEFDTTPVLTGAKIGEDGSYLYASSNKTDSTAVFPQGTNGNVTLEYKINTGLDFFGHKVHVWFDERNPGGTESIVAGTAANDDSLGTKSFDSKFPTYAIIDKATLVKTVFSSAKSDTDLLTAKKAATTGLTSVYDAAKEAGFHKDSNPQWGSDRFSQMGQLKSWTATGDAATAVQSEVGMYRIISNNNDKKADVVISLNQEVAQINQRNTTAVDGYYIFLDSGDSYFGSKLVNGAQAGQIFDDQLSAASDKTLGDVVTVHEIVGTNSDAKVHNQAAVDRKWNAGAAVTVAANVCWYQTDKLEPTMTGTIATYKLSTPTTTLVTEVTLTDGTNLKLSGITGSKEDYGFDTTYNHLINGPTKLVDTNTKAGITYDYYFDEVGRFIGVRIPNDYTFLYTTFADYQVGALGTGTIGYYAYGVDWDGNIVKDKAITKITLPTDNDGATPPKYTFDEKSQVTGTAASATFPGTGNTPTLAQGYNILPVTLKDQGTSVVGNQIKDGYNYRMMVDPDGKMTYYREGGQYGHRFVNWYDETNKKEVATWTLTAQDAKNGFARVYNQDTAVGTTAAAAGKAATGKNVDYLLTNETKFIVVTGSGTADLAVKIYNGIADLVGSNTSVEIDSKYDIAGTEQKGDVVYFRTKADQFGSTTVDDNRTISTVIMSDKNLTGVSTQTLFFAAPGKGATGVKLAGCDDAAVNQYKLWNGGKEGYYWVKDDAGVAASGTATTGDFYTLAQIDTVNGQPIYKAVKVTEVADYNNAVDDQYKYIVVNNVSTAEIGGKVYDVTGATVTQVWGDNQTNADTAFPNGANISDVLTLNHAVSMGDGTGDTAATAPLYTLKVAIVFDGVKVSTIYVTDVTLTT